MKPRQVLEKAQTEQFTWVDYCADDTPFDRGKEEGIEEPLELYGALPEADIVTFQAKLPAPLPSEIRELLGFASGFTIGADEVSFTSYNDWGYEFLFPHVIVLADDGGGNSWVIEINPETGDWRHVWFVCHDPPVVVYQCETLPEFIDGILDESRFDKCRGGHRSILYHIDDMCMSVWRNRRNLPKAASLRESDDPVVREFAKDLDERALVADLRRPTMGDGFDWSPLSAGRSPVKRAGLELLFAIEPRKGIFRRLFGS